MKLLLSILVAASTFFGGLSASAQQHNNIILIVSDNTGYGDLGPYGGSEGRGMPTPNIDRLAKEGLTMFSFYIAEPNALRPMNT